MDIHSPKLNMEWRFPLPDTHAGILMGNGLFGVSVWGDERLCLTINRADFWDRREASGITSRMNYADLKRFWTTADQAGIDQMVQSDPSVPIPVPTGLPMGRIELEINKGARSLLPEPPGGCSAQKTPGPFFGSLQMAHGVLEIQEEGTEIPLRLMVSADQPLLLIETDRTDLEITRRPAREFLGDYFESIGHEPPEMFDEGNLIGWTQALPADPCLCLACGRVTGGLAVTAVYGETPEEAKANGVALLQRVEEDGLHAVFRSTQRWWQNYWEKIPQVDLPSVEAEEVYYFGLFKLAGLTKEHAALLQGPWVEEYQMPDCSNDFHFNINVQMCYWPAYAANCLELLEPLFDKLKEWDPLLRSNAKLLFDVDDGIFLPMSVNDNGRWNANFWPSFIDFATTGWTAHLLWLHYRYTLDTDFLRSTVYPFMKGAMRIYEAVLEEEEGQMVLPMSTSPEYGWSGNQAVGRSPSFQLACIHFLLESLITAAELLDVDPQEAATWRRLQEKVPPFTTFTDAESKRPAERQGPGAELDVLPRLAIFEGQDLEFSHRHHGHLAAIHPFDTIDPEDQDIDRVVRPTIRHWVEIGTGNWIAFSFTAASILYSRMKQGEAAYLHYELWYHAFANEYRGAVELAHTPGLTTWTDDQNSTPMQMDAAMGAVNAIQEMLLHTVRGRMCLFPAMPRVWQRAARFEKMRAEGAFLVTAEMRDGRIIFVEVFSEKGADLKLANNIAEEVVIRSGEKEERTKAKVLTLQTKPGETITILPQGLQPA